MEKRKPLLDFLRTLRRFFRRKPEPLDPYARVRVPVRKGPPNRSGAVALEEPRG